MKKLFLFVAIAGFINLSYAKTIVPKGTTGVTQDDKKDSTKKHHDCSKHEKGKCCEMKQDSAHHCSKHSKEECEKLKKEGKCQHHDCSKHPKGKCDMHSKDSVKTK